ncbi:asparagine synthase-related protein [Niveispirillum sp. SYP-B3756]|uniref:asparagine synthase-related protein n=1 Tax=Niveispirillum sp. SYP-B3756 TaxID=2662178 RepID=UPI001562FD78
MRGDAAPVSDHYSRIYAGHNAAKTVGAAALFVEGAAARMLQVRDPAGRIWHIVSDGRLDDRDRLATGLCQPETASDEELLAAAFAQWGPAFPWHITGSYAFMAWDAAADILILARDPVGGYPIFYHKDKDGTGIAFATDLAALLVGKPGRARLRPEMLAGILGRAPGLTGIGSFYRDVDLLPAGHLLRLDSGVMSVHRWWRPPPVRVREQPAAELRHLLTAAVEERLRGGRQCAVLLSGGLDSSAIACLAARRLRQDGRRLLAISSVLPDGWTGPETDERHHIEAVRAQEDNIDIHWVRENPQTQPFGALSRTFELLNCPPYSAVTHMEAALSAAGQQHGADRVLSGFGGDFFASSRPNTFPLALACEGDWQAAWRELAAMRRNGASWTALARRELLGPLAQTGRQRVQVPSIVGPSLRPFLTRRRRLFGQGIPIIATARRQMAFLLEPSRIELTVNGATQVSAKAFSQTLVFPMLDRRLLEFMLSLPGRQMRQDGIPRSLFRQAMAGILPETIRQRPDKGPAFDPLIAARLAAARSELMAWATATAGHRCWEMVDREDFLAELSKISPTNREGWRQGMFASVLLGGMIAHFIQWHSERWPDQEPGTP